MVVQSIPIGKMIPVIPGFFSLTHITNPGAAWGILAGRAWLLLAISIVTSLITSLFSLRNLTMVQAIGSLIMTVVVFLYPYLRLKTGKVKIVSTTDMSATAESK